MPDRSCVACAGALTQVLDLGEQPLVDELHSSKQAAMAAERFPLRLCRCQECAWVQLDSTPEPSRMFAEDYPYRSSISEGVVQSARDHAGQLIRERSLDPHSLVVEIASNDGYQLQWFQAQDIPVLGIDPAPGPVEEAQRRGVKTRLAFFTADLAVELVDHHGLADVVLAKNVLAHVPDPADFLTGIRHLIGPSGIAVFEFPYLRDLLAQGQFDTIYHEHRSYLAIAPLHALLRRCGLRIRAVDELSLHGGSLRVVVGAEDDPSNGDLERYLRLEDAGGWNTRCALDEFAGRVEDRIERIQGLVHQQRAQGRRLVAYGAAAKGVILLNSCGLDGEDIEFAVDRNPVKHCCFMPGSGLEVRTVEDWLQSSPEVTLLLAWNHAEEIRRQQAGYGENGGRWLIPIPRPQLV